MLGAAGVETLPNLGGADGGDVVGARQHVVDALAIGAVGRQRLAPRVELMTPGVHEALGEHVKLHRLGTEPPDTAAVEALHAVRGFQVGVNVDRLVHVQTPLRSPAERVEDVVGVLGAETGEHDLGLVGLAARLARLEVDQLGAVGDIGAAVARGHAGRDQQAVGEDGGLVGFAVAVGVLKDDDLVVGLLARLDLRVDLAGGDPKPALRVEVHLDRLGEQRVGRVQRDLEALRDDERLAFDLGVRIRDGGVRLGEERSDRQQR